MISIGIRVKPSCVYYSIISSDEETFNIHTYSKIVVPQSLYVPDRLSFIRNTFLSIFLEYKIENAGIRTIESLVSPDVNRIYLEGVIQELISNSIIEKYFTGKKSKLASILGEDVEKITQYIDGKIKFGEIEYWNDLCKEEKESIITAVAAGCI